MENNNNNPTGENPNTSGSSPNPSGGNPNPSGGNPNDINMSDKKNHNNVDEDQCGCPHTGNKSNISQSNCEHEKIKFMENSDVGGLRCCYCGLESPDCSCAVENCCCVFHEDCNNKTLK